MKVTIAPNKTEEEFKIRSKSGKYTEPELPSSVIVSENGVVIEHYYRSNDHAPAHMHVTGDGTNGKIRIGANGRVLDGDPPLNSKQKKVVDNNLSKIRRAGDKIKRWLAFHDNLIDK
jgi:hypothetical protein